ncbi:hypothetical protein [Mesorhizobium sp.]|uniref:hypothetical protein n=1 Tax=Mesorhizobium sp. TaxID=1871066 RepID=UPI00257BCA17|nr:hypothetical protein [Mesorhizobium sp.]
MLRTAGLDQNTAMADLDDLMPLDRVAPQGIADVVLSFALDTARYMCGTLVEANGGKAVA